MSRVVSVKGWSKYQHYKDRSPPWVKLYGDTLSTEAWVLGTDLSRLVQLASTMLAARYDNKIPLNFTLLKKVASLDCSEDQFIIAIDHLTTHDFLEIQDIDDGRLHPASKPLATCATTPSVLYSEESRAEERRVEKSRGDTSAASRPAQAPEFSEFKSVYPKRGGGQPWSKALKAINARLRTGSTWNEILCGTRRYAEFIRATGKEGSEFVLQAATFCGPDERYREAWAPPAEKETTFEEIMRLNGRTPARKPDDTVIEHDNPFRIAG